jgi:hypothetical protein
MVDRADLGAPQVHGGGVTQLERRILATVVEMAREGLRPRSYYLRPRDHKRLRRETIDGRPVRVTCSEKAASRIYAVGGVARTIR